MDYIDTLALCFLFDCLGLHVLQRRTRAGAQGTSPVVMTGRLHSNSCLYGDGSIWQKIACAAKVIAWEVVDAAMSSASI